MTVARWRSGGTVREGAARQFTERGWTIEIWERPATARWRRAAAAASNK